MRHTKTSTVQWQSEAGSKRNKLNTTQWLCISMFGRHGVFGCQEVNASQSMSMKNKVLNSQNEWMDLSLPIQAGSSREGGCTGIWVGRPSMMDCKAVHIYFPRSRPKERARSVISQGASSTCLTPLTAWSELLMKTLTTAGPEPCKIREYVLWCGSDIAR